MSTPCAINSGSVRRIFRAVPVSICRMGCQLTGHNRRSNRLPDWDYSWPWWYFVTICVHGRESIFGKIDRDAMVLDRLGRFVHDAWLLLPVSCPSVELDEFVVMPNHLHGIVTLNDHSVGAIPTRRQMLKGWAGMNRPYGLNGIFQWTNAPNSAGR